MLFRSKRLNGLLSVLFVLATTIAWQSASAEDVVHAVSGVVKSFDKDAKTVVVKTADGTEHTIKYSDKTSIRVGKQIEHGGADAWLGTKEGERVTVRYTSRAGKETAIGVKDAAQKTGDALKK